jgi:putative endonuclease
MKMIRIFLFMDFVVYILYSNGSIRNYTGYTSNLIRRFHSHNLFGKDSTRFYRPWFVIHVEFFPTKEEAMKKEKYYKSGRGSLRKKELINAYLKNWAHTLP